MRALVLDAAVRLDPDCPEPVRAPGEALVAVRVTGVCDTDLQLLRGYMGFRGVPGHEVVGTVLAADEARWVGRRVVMDINAGCGACDRCRQGDDHHCQRRTVLGILGRSGAFAERLVMPERCLVEVPAGVDDDRAVFAEPLAAALHVEDALSSREARVAVLGDGKLGILVALALAAQGREVTLVGHHPAKLELARTMAGRSLSTLLESEARPQLAGVDAVVEATGSAAGLALALSLVRPRGTVVLKTTVKDPVAVDLALAVVNEITLVGSRCGDLGRAIALLATGVLDPTPLIEARYPLRDAVEALAHASRRGATKILVDVEA